MLVGKFITHFKTALPILFFCSAMSHTLVLKLGQYPQNAIRIFKLENLQTLHQHIIDAVFSKKVSIRSDKLNNIKMLLNHETKDEIKTAFHQFEREQYHTLNSEEKLVLKQ